MGDAGFDPLLPSELLGLLFASPVDALDGPAGLTTLAVLGRAGGDAALRSAEG